MSAFEVRPDEQPEANVREPCKNVAPVKDTHVTGHALGVHHLDLTRCVSNQRKCSERKEKDVPSDSVLEPNAEVQSPDQKAANLSYQDQRRQGIGEHK